MPNPLRWYVEVAALITVAWLVLWGAASLWPQVARAWLRGSHLALVLALGLPAATGWLPREALPKPSVQVWEGRSRGGAAAAETVIAPRSRPEARIPQGWALSARSIAGGTWVALAAVLAALVWHVGRLRSLARALRGHVEVRRVGRVSILVSEHDAAPYSVWLPRRAYVVVPLGWLARREDLGIAVRHELQHHRQRDTLWVHLNEFCRALFFWHPAAHGWARLSERLQELACDEALIGRRGISPQAYGSCLVRAAQQAMGASPVALAGTASMAASRSGRFLKRRVEMIFLNNRSRVKSSFATVVAVTGTLGLMATTALAARGLVQDRRLTMGEAQWIAARTTAEQRRGASDGLGASSRYGEVPIEVNELVLAKLNRYLGTPEGRESVKAGLARMQQYRPLIDRRLREAGFPLELIAVPMEESRFVNDAVSPASSTTRKARGLWQFIPQTARNYGLRVDAQVDERLDVDKSTEAALRYLRDLMGLFGDWRLALKAYNEGERRVLALIDEHGTRDPWALERLSLAPGRESYLAGMIAMTLILRNPEMLD